MTAIYSPYTLSNSDDCHICSDPLNNGEPTLAHDHQQHPVHQKCIKQWLIRNSICPICKTSIDSSALITRKERVIYELKLMKENAIAGAKGGLILTATMVACVKPILLFLRTGDSDRINNSEISAFIGGSIVGHRLIKKIVDRVLEELSPHAYLGVHLGLDIGMFIGAFLPAPSFIDNVSRIALSGIFGAGIGSSIGGVLGRVYEQR